MGYEDSIFELDGLQIESLKAANIDKDVLILIYRDYIKNQEILRQQAQYFGNILQLGDEINSIKWRVKDPLHLLIKIVRKRKEAITEGKASPYLKISVDNYKNIISDLVGIRAIYLFKENWAWVNEFILSNFSVCQNEKIAIYHAADDDLDFYLKRKDMSAEYSYELIERESRYRSTHYIIKAIAPHSFNFELQTRTILDEAWGEIDHHIRYPNFEHHPELKRKMSILNGAISGCEELTSHYFNYFNKLSVKSIEGSDLISIENTPLSLGKDNTSDEPCIKETVEISANVSDELWDNTILNAALSRERERKLRSLKILDHSKIHENENTNKKLLEDILLRGVMLNLKSETSNKDKVEVDDGKTSIAKYKKMITSISDELPIKKYDSKDES